MKFRVGAVVAALMVGWWGMPMAGAAEEPGTESCYVVADSNADAPDGDAEDLLIRVDRLGPDPATDETAVGTGTGTFDIEAIAFQPGTGALLAVDGGVLGTLDAATGRFTAIGEIGVGTGTEGEVELDNVDGLTFDPGTGFLYGTRRRSDADPLFRIDPLTGAVVAGAIVGADYAVIPEVEDLPDIDEIAIDPSDGQMYAVANDDGRDDRLIRVDKLTGGSADVGAMEIEDVEGLAFAGDQLIGTTGKASDDQGLWDIDKTTGAAGNLRPLDNGRDYEAVDCFTPAEAAAPVDAAAPVEAPAPSEPAPVREPQQAEAATPVATPPAAEPAVTAPVLLAELPRTGQNGSRHLVLGSGVILALGGLAVLGGTRRPLRRGCHRI